MQGIELAYCNVCVNALIGAWRSLMEASATEVLQKTPYGKGDTLGLDAITEITISGRLFEFDKHAIFITEELDSQAHRRWPTDSDPVKQPLMFFSDPTDRSIQLQKFFDEVSRGHPTEKIGQLMATTDSGPDKRWEKMFEGPTSITGPTTAITCVRKGEIVFSAILNLITRDLFIISDAGVYAYKLEPFDDPANEKVALETVIEKGRRLAFPSARELGYTADECRRFVTFLGKEGYRENFDDSGIFVENPDGFLHHTRPPGPPRVLYLSDMQTREYGAVGFVLSNGEKIGEWIHWLAFVKYAKGKNGGQALRAFEVVLSRPWTKNGMLMSTSAPYSIFCMDKAMSYLDISRLRNFERPSQFRCMLVVTRFDNERLIHILQQHQYREVTSSF